MEKNPSLNWVATPNIHLYSAIQASFSGSGYVDMDVVMAALTKQSGGGSTLFNFSFTQSEREEFYLVDGQFTQSVRGGFNFLNESLNLSLRGGLYFHQWQA
jgi:hypothetical protein